MSTTKFTTISDAEILQMLGSLRHRAEKADDLSAYAPSFVPVIDTQLLANKNTQVIYGRNGTGKTHILKCFEEQMFYHVGTFHVLPVYFDMRTLDLSRIAPEVSEVDIVETFFSSFLSECVERINTFVLKRMQLSDAHGAYLSSASVHTKFRAAIKRLRRAIGNDRIKERVESYSKSIKTTTNESAGGRAALHFSATPTGELSAEGGKSKAREEFVELVIKTSHFIDFGEIREGFNDLTSALQIDHIAFLIDEWSQIDIKLQPIFAELIRRTIGTCNNISCKIAALKFLTAFTEELPGKRIGLQPGIDITELSDLNHIFTFDLDRSSVRSFLTFILLKHLLEVLGRHRYNYNFETDSSFIIGDVTLIFNRLFGHIFESAEAFDYFVRASEGNPRDFLAMIAECCATHGAANLPIPLKAVQASAIGYFTNSKMANFSSSQSKSLELFEKIFKRALSNKSKVFSVTKTIDIKSETLKDLWSQRVIHLIENSYEYFDSETSSIKSYAIYAVDYGKILGLRSDGAGGQALEGIVKDTKRIVTGLYDGMSHRAILESIEREDSSLAKVSEIMGSSPDASSVMEQVDAMTPGQIHAEIERISMDDLVSSQP